MSETCTNNNNNLISTDSVRYDKALIRPLPTKVYYGLEYPANVQNAQKAIESVGGLSKIANVIKSNEKEYLQLKFRPGNPTCKPTFGAKSPTCHLLLRVRPIKPQKQTQQTQTPSNNYDDMDSPRPFVSDSPKPIDTQHTQTQAQQPTFESTIIALVPTTIKFDGLCDFQYFFEDKQTKTTPQPTTTTTNTTPQTTTATTSTSTTKKDQFYVQNNGTDEISKDEPMQLIPPMFSRIDYPNHYLFKSNPNARFDPNTNQFNISKQTARKPATHNHFNNEVPQNSQTQLPSQYVINDLMQRTRDIMVSLFESRPIWIYISLVDRVQKEGGLILHTKKLLPTMAFNFIDGPWRKCWVKLGYDPRIHPETARYQAIDFRISDQESHFATNNNKLINLNNTNNINSQLKDNANGNETPRRIYGDTFVGSTGGLFGEKKLNPKRNKIPDINTFEFQKNAHAQSSNNNNNSETSNNNNNNNNNNNDDDVVDTFYSPPPYDYTFKTAPSMLNNLYQICDIEEPSIKSYWESVQTQTTCMKRFGWFSEKSFKEGVDRMKTRYGVTDYKLRFKSKNPPTRIRKKVTTTGTDGDKGGKEKSNDNGNDGNEIDDSNIDSCSTNNENNQDKMMLDDFDLVQNKEIDESLLKRDTLDQMEKDNEYLQRRGIDEFHGIDMVNVGGFEDTDDFENSKPFDLLDDDSITGVQMKQMDEYFGIHSNFNDDQESSDEEISDDDDDNEIDDSDYSH